MTVVENVMVGAFFGKGNKKLRNEEAKAEAQKWLEFVGLKVDQRTMPGELTAGNLRRLELARGIGYPPSSSFS